MAFSALSRQSPINDYEKRYTTSDADVVATAVQTEAVALESYNRVSVQVATTVDASAGTDTVTTKLQGSHDGTSWFDLPDVAGTGQDGTVTHTADSAAETFVDQLNYDFSQGSGQTKPRFIRLDSVSSGANGTKEVALDIFLTKQGR